MFILLSVCMAGVFWLASPFTFITNIAFFNALLSIPGYIVSDVLLFGLCGLRIVNEWERVPVLRLGKLVNVSGPGLVWNEPVLHAYMEEVDLQDDTTEHEVDNVQTKDNIPVGIKFMLTGHVDANKVRDFVVNVNDGYHAVEKRAIAAASAILGQFELDTIQHDRPKVAARILAQLQEAVSGWGFIVTDIGISNVKIADPEIEKAIALKARAQKEAEAELARAQKQFEIATALKAAAAVYDERTMELRKLEVMVELTRSAQNNTILYPADIFTSAAPAIAQIANGKPRIGNATVGA